MIFKECAKMIIVYSSNTGYTKQYAELLHKELGYPTFPIDKVPAYYNGSDAIYLGWLLAGRVYGYSAAQCRLNVKCVVAVGMTAESAAQEEFLHGKNKLSPIVPLFYLQGGYDYNKLHGIFKLMMSVKTKEILARYDAKSEAEREKDATYKMVTRGYSVVSPERIARVADWAKAL